MACHGLPPFFSRSRGILRATSPGISCSHLVDVWKAEQRWSARVKRHVFSSGSLAYDQLELRNWWTGKNWDGNIIFMTGFWAWLLSKIIGDSAWPNVQTFKDRLCRGFTSFTLSQWWKHLKVLEGMVKQSSLQFSRSIFHIFVSTK